MFRHVSKTGKGRRGKEEQAFLQFRLKVRHKTPFLSPFESLVSEGEEETVCRSFEWAAKKGSEEEDRSRSKPIFSFLFFLAFGRECVVIGGRGGGVAVR